MQENVYKLKLCLDGILMISVCRSKINVNTVGNHMFQAEFQNARIERSSCLEVFASRLKGVPKNFTKFKGKHLCWSLFFHKVAGLRPVTLLKYRLQTQVFLWILWNFKKTFLKEYLRWLLLNRFKVVSILWLSTHSANFNLFFGSSRSRKWLFEKMLKTFYFSTVASLDL